MRLEGLGKLKKKIHLMGTQTRDLPACSIVPPPTTLPRAHYCNTCIISVHLEIGYRILGNMINFLQHMHGRFWVFVLTENLVISEQSCLPVHKL
jgi:hypothetical protein